MSVDILKELSNRDLFVVSNTFLLLQQEVLLLWTRWQTCLFVHNIEVMMEEEFQIIVNKEEQVVYQDNVTNKHVVLNKVMKKPKASTGVLE